ncbi:hypothetical protein CCACVL1_23971 [Corchorus capsularis]|uniref:Uncharacterized protein n=1 Tax=Corchorus capsularis TaxID=210143 RepID=A0A1R3GRJ9_COCAP|nr:hypothetical protein CCACVL1_23971 [Corchorus capsularis]
MAQDKMVKGAYSRLKQEQKSFTLHNSGGNVDRKTKWAKLAFSLEPLIKVRPISIDRRLPWWMRTA